MDGTNSKGKSSPAAMDTIAEVASACCKPFSKPKQTKDTFADIAFQRDWLNKHHRPIRAFHDTAL